MVSIERVVAINVCNSKQKPWMVTPELVDGVEVVKISKYDSGFSRFVTDGCDSSSLSAMGWLDELKALRLKASLDLNKSRQGQEKLLFGDVAPSKRQAKKEKHECKTRLQLGDLPKFVEISLPELQHQGELVPGCRLLVVATLDLNAKVQVQLQADSLNYIRKAMQASVKESPDDVSSVSRSTGVYWRPERNAYICKRKVDGTFKYQSFKVEKDEDSQATLERANRWVNGEDD